MPVICQNMEGAKANHILENSKTSPGEFPKIGGTDVTKILLVATQR